MRIVSLFCCGILAGTCLNAASTNESRKNLALGRPIAVYPIEKDRPSGEAAKLTDGRYANSIMWADENAIGWSSDAPRSVTIDLGENSAISGISLGTAMGARIVFGTEGKVWPGLIDLFASNDNTQWYYLGELGEMHDRENEPFPGINGTEYRKETLRASLKTHGRYLKLIFTAHKNFFLDEIEIYAGDPEWLSTPLPTPAISSNELYQFIEQQDGTARVLRQQYRQDIAAVLEKLSSIPEEAAKPIRQALATLKGRIETDTVVPADRRVTLPSGKLGEEILQQRAAFYQALKHAPIVLWQTDLWQFLDWMQDPPGNENPVKIDLPLLRDEYRSVSINLTNTTDSERSLTLSISGLPGGDNPDYITVHPVLWTTTSWREAVATALSNPTKTSDGFKFTIPSGVTRQIWFTVKGPETAGKFDGRITITSDTPEVSIPAIPFHLDVHPRQLPARRTLHLGGWDYSESASYGAHSANVKPIIDHLRSRFVDSPWGWPGNMPFGRFSEANTYATEEDQPNTARFDKWVKESWPGAYRYYVYMEVHGRKGENTFEGLDYKADREKFEARIATWARFWEKHVQKQGLQPEQVCIQITDEIGGNPNNPFFKDEILRAWTEAIKKSGVGFKLWLNPIYDEPWNADQAALAATDILCGKYNRFMDNCQRYRDFWANQLAPGRELAFYECRSSPTELYDPYSYFRLQAWLAWKYQAKSMFFWAFADNGTRPGNSFDPGRKVSGFSPLFLDDSASVIGSKQMEAIREGVEDYEYLVLLRDAIANAKTRQAASPALVAKAEELLNTAPDRVFRVDDIQKQPRWLWKTAINRSNADTVRIEILEILRELEK